MGIEGSTPSASVVSFFPETPPKHWGALGVKAKHTLWMTVSIQGFINLSCNCQPCGDGNEHTHKRTKKLLSTYGRLFLCHSRISLSLEITVPISRRRINTPTKLYKAHERGSRVRSEDC